MRLKNLFVGLGGLLLPLATAGAMELIINGQVFSGVNTINVHQSGTTVTITTTPELDLGGDGGGGGGGDDTIYHTATASAGTGGTITPTSRTVANGTPTTFTVTASSGYAISTVTGCGGSLSGSTYTTGAISGNCTVSASFSSTGGGGGGGSDPGTGFWATEYKGSAVYVVDRSPHSFRTYYTGCLGNDIPELGLKHNRSLSPFNSPSCREIGSIRATDVFAQRFPFKGGDNSMTIKIDKADSGEVGSQQYQTALSTIPGDFTSVPTGCLKDRNATISVINRTVWETLSPMFQRAYCPVDAETMYYYNIRPAPGTTGATECGKSDYICRAQVIDSVRSEQYF